MAFLWFPILGELVRYNKWQLYDGIEFCTPIILLQPISIINYVMLNLTVILIKHLIQNISVKSQFLLLHMINSKKKQT